LVKAEVGSWPSLRGGPDGPRADPEGPGACPEHLEGPEAEAKAETEGVAKTEKAEVEEGPRALAEGMV
jgi:hypothetical protein